AGADRIAVWPASRSIVRMTDDQVLKTHAKFDRRVFEASKQARRSRRPLVQISGQQEDVIRVVQGASLAILLEESATQNLADVVPATETRTADLPEAAGSENAQLVLIVGPEGGFSDAERTQFREVGAVSARMGPDVLRASTAATVALGWVMGATGRWSMSD
ncbi:MAG: RNA methyltransferase, partial [Actinobacteria bacterium]|nr:RNA methyltransferase [Actinomycetota bacterium]